jgi:hypothetical protein
MENNRSALPFEERKTKKTWLRLTFVRFVVLVLVRMGIPLVIALANGHSGATEIAQAILPLLFGAMLFWTFFHCSYKKFGTKFITFYLVVEPLLLLAGWIFCILSMLDIRLIPVEWTRLDVAMGVVDILVAIPWYVTGWKLRKINKAYRANRLSSQPAPV